MPKKTRQLGATIKSKDDSAKKLTFTITTDAIDRYGESITPSGWDLSNHAKNPIVLVDHIGSAEKVIGRARVFATENGLDAEVEFAVEESPLAALIYRLYVGGFLHAVSVGFLEKKGEFRRVGDREVWHILEKELLEFSAVAIPANPEALVQKGFTKEEIRTLGVKVEEEDDEKLKKIFVKNHAVMQSYRKGMESIRKALDIAPEEDEKTTVEKTVKAVIDILPKKQEWYHGTENQSTPESKRTLDAEEIARNILARV